MKNIFPLIFSVIVSFSTYAQSNKNVNYLSEPIIVDSLSTIMIPVIYDMPFLSSSKLGYGEIYSNIVFYDFKKDSYHKLFNDDTFIKSFRPEYNYYNSDKSLKLDFVSKKWIFYFVKNKDFNENKKIDSNDPYILYVSDKYGNELKPLTNESENAVSIKIYESQGFALIKMQRDLDKDKNFEYEDKSYYFIRLELSTLSLGNKIEVQK